MMHAAPADHTAASAAMQRWGGGQQHQQLVRRRAALLHTAAGLCWGAHVKRIVSEAYGMQCVSLSSTLRDR
jgi:hypothetical protein